jgi:hypothetical protein
MPLIVGTVVRPDAITRPARRWRRTPVGPLDHLALHAFDLVEACLRQPLDQLRRWPAVGRDDRVVEGDDLVLAVEEAEYQHAQKVPGAAGTRSTPPTVRLGSCGWSRTS